MGLMSAHADVARLNRSVQRQWGGIIEVWAAVTTITLGDHLDRSVDVPSLNQVYLASTIDRFWMTGDTFLCLWRLGMRYWRWVAMTAIALYLALIDNGPGRFCILSTGQRSTVTIGIRTLRTLSIPCRREIGCFGKLSKYHLSGYIIWTLREMMRVVFFFRDYMTHFTIQWSSDATAQQMGLVGSHTDIAGLV